nr:CPBP family intramembrane glutamic endopeptidase [Caulobacter sp. 17J80-11]
MDPAVALLAGAIAVAGLVTSPFERRFFRSDLTTGRKLCVYAGSMLLLWALTAAALGVYGWTALRESPAGPTAWLSDHRIAGVALGAVVAAYFVIGLLPLLQSLRGARWRQAYAAAIRRHGAAFPGLLPNDALECVVFALLSLTAGFCEEVLFRGFLIRFLHGSAPDVPLAGALIVSSAVFGLNHAYQGARGVLSTAVAGFAFGLVFLLSGDLVPGIVLHVMVDLQVAYVLRPSLQTARGAAPAASR